MRIWSPGQTGKTAIFQLVKLGPDLSEQNLVQNRNQRLRRLIVSGIDVRRPNCVGCSVPGSREAGHGILVEDVQDIKVERQFISPFGTEPIVMGPGKIRLREGRSSSQISPLD